MKIYLIAVAFAIGSAATLVNACMFHDTPTHATPIKLNLYN